SVGAGAAWLIGCIAAVGIGAAQGVPGDLAPAAGALRAVAPLLAAAAGAQILLGALSYLLPVQVSRGPSSVRAANRAIDRGAVFRVTLANASLLLYVLPTPSMITVIASVVYLACMVAFLPLMVASIRAARRESLPADGALPPVVRADASGTAARERRSAPQLIAALGSVLAIVVAGVAVD